MGPPAALRLRSAVGCRRPRVSGPLRLLLPNVRLRLGRGMEEARTDGSLRERDAPYRALGLTSQARRSALPIRIDRATRRGQTASSLAAFHVQRSKLFAKRCTAPIEARRSRGLSRFI